MQIHMFSVILLWNKTLIIPLYFVNLLNLTNVSLHIISFNLTAGYKSSKRRFSCHNKEQEPFPLLSAILSDVTFVSKSGNSFSSLIEPPPPPSTLETGVRSAIFLSWCLLLPLCYLSESRVVRSISCYPSLHMPVRCGKHAWIMSEGMGSMLGMPQPGNVGRMPEQQPIFVSIFSCWETRSLQWDTCLVMPTCTVGHGRQVTAVTRLPRWRRRKTRLQARTLLTML